MGSKNKTKQRNKELALARRKGKPIHENFQDLEVKDKIGTLKSYLRNCEDDIQKWPNNIHIQNKILMYQRQIEELENPPFKVTENSAEKVDDGQETKSRNSIEDSSLIDTNLGNQSKNDSSPDNSLISEVKE